MRSPTRCALSAQSEHPRDCERSTAAREKRASPPPSGPRRCCFQGKGWSSGTAASRSKRKLELALLDAAATGRPQGLRSYRSMTDQPGTMKHDSDAERARLVDAMHRVAADEEYFAFNLTATEDGRIVTEVQSEFVAWHPRQKGWELRKASLINPGLYKLSFGEGNYVVVHDEEQLAVWTVCGGPALVEESTARAHLADLLEPHESVPTWFEGFRHPDDLPPGALSRRPGRAGRRAVKARDNWRCRICHRHADDAAGVRLTLHHVRPREWGGLTIFENLLTLCTDCQQRLNPHFDRSLIPLVAPLPALGEGRDDAGVRRYRELMRAGLRAEESEGESD